MSQEPKKRHSRARQGKRRASISHVAVDPAHRLNHFYQMQARDKAELEAKTTKTVVKKSSEQEDE
jgi:hypothetical protein